MKLLGPSKSMYQVEYCYKRRPGHHSTSLPKQMYNIRLSRKMKPEQNERPRALLEKSNLTPRPMSVLSTSQPIVKIARPISVPLPLACSHSSRGSLNHNC